MNHSNILLRAAFEHKLVDIFKIIYTVYVWLDCML